MAVLGGVNGTHTMAADFALRGFKIGIFCLFQETITKGLPTHLKKLIGEEVK